jgi:hypothetical protein
MKVEGPLWSLCRNDGSDAPLSARGFGWLFTGDNGNCFSQVDIDLSGITKVPERGLYRLFNDLSDATGRVRGFEDITDVALSGMAVFAYDTNLELGDGGHVSFTKLSSVGDAGMKYAFNNASGISSVTYPEMEMASHGSFSYTFCQCPNLRWASFPSLKDVVGSNAATYTFASCATLERVYFPELRRLSGASWMFKDASALTSLDLPELSAISAEAFLTRTGLTSASFPKLSSCDLLRYWFYACPNLVSVDFPELTRAVGTNVGQYTFTSSSIQTLSFPKLQALGGDAKWCDDFAKDCIYLTSFSAPELTNIWGARNLFSGCSALETVDVHNLQQGGYWHNAFYGCSSLTAFDAP